MRAGQEGWVKEKEEREETGGDSRDDNVVAACFNNNVNSIVAPCQRWETGMYIALKERVNQRVVSCSPIRSGCNDNPVFERGPMGVVWR